MGWADRIALAAFRASLLSAVTALAQSPSRPPRFEDYPVEQMYNGPLVDPVIRTPEERMYRTVLREGIRTGLGVGEGAQRVSKPEPTFAGRYVVIRWGCGSDCRMMGLVDAKTGAVHPPPLGGKGDHYFEVPLAQLDDKAHVDFRVNSRLMIVRHACPDAATCGDYYFLWESGKFRLLFKQPLKLKIWTNR
jgi:hypothetical protein